MLEVSCVRTTISSLVAGRPHIVAARYSGNNRINPEGVCLMKTIISLAATITVFLLSAHHVDSEAKTLSNTRITYLTYNNERYDYSIDYPLGVLYPQGEALNGDGQRFLSKDKRGKAFVAAWGNALFHTMKQEMNEDIDPKSNPKRIVTYRILKKNWFVLSGYEDGKIFYEKMLLKHGFFYDYGIDYPKDQKRLWDPVVRRMARSFTANS
jgi:hypothetical protein